MPLSLLGHCNSIVHICHTATRLQPKIGTVLRMRDFHMTLALSLTGNCQLPCWLNLPPDCAFLNSTWPWHLSEQPGTLCDGTGSVINTHFPAVYHPQVPHMEGPCLHRALSSKSLHLCHIMDPTRAKLLLGLMPSQPHVFSFPQMAKDWLSLSSGRPACLRPSVFPGSFFYRVEWCWRKQLGQGRNRRMILHSCFLFTLRPLL